MAETGVFWLRVAAALYSLGLLHAILTLVRRRDSLFRVALGAFGLGAVFHLVSIIDDGPRCCQSIAPPIRSIAGRTHGER
jgi:hypothetical protein